MCQIAICDCDFKISGNIEQMIHKLAQDTSIIIHTEVFGSGEELYAHLKAGYRFDVILTDIILKELNGIELGKKIRNELGNTLLKIVFISDRPDLLKDAFEARPDDFVEKPIENPSFEDRLTYVIMRMIDMIFSNKKDFFSYQVGLQQCRELIKDIYYFEVRKGTVFIKTVFGMDNFCGSLIDIIKKVDEEDFFRVHKNYLVNCYHIRNYTGYDVCLSNGESIPMGVNNYKKLLKRLRPEIN